MFVSRSALPVHTPFAVSKAVLQPTSSSSFGPRVRPAGLHNDTPYIASITPAVEMRRTAPCVVTPPICGMERKNLWVPGSHTGCSAPLVAKGSEIVVPRVSLQVALSTLIRVPYGGEAALLIARMSPSAGSYASSSARVGSVSLVWTSLTVLGGVKLLSKHSTRLARGIGYKKPGLRRRGGSDAVGTGAIVGAGIGRAHRRRGTWSKPVERAEAVVRRELRDRYRRLGVEGIDNLIR